MYENCDNEEYKEEEIKIKVSSTFDCSGNLILNSYTKDIFFTSPLDTGEFENIFINLHNLNNLSSKRENYIKTKYYLLELSIGTIKFKVHPLMSEEELIESKLIDLYQIYHKKLIKK